MILRFTLSTTILTFLFLSSCGFFQGEKKSLRNTIGLSENADSENSTNSDSSQNSKNSDTLEQSEQEIVSCSLGYQEDIKPILNDNCISCHSSANPSGGYNFENMQSLEKWQTALKSIQEGRMPIGKALPLKDLLTFETWIGQGVPDNRAGKVACNIEDVINPDCEAPLKAEAVFPLSYGSYSNSLANYFVAPDMEIPVDNSIEFYQNVDSGEMSVVR